MLPLKPGQHQTCNTVNSFELRCGSVTFNNYAMDTSSLPDAYTRSMRATGQRAEGAYISWQITNAHGITNM